MASQIHELPQKGSVWRHHSGRLYRVLMLTNVAGEGEEPYPVTVVYEGTNGNVWSGKASDWHRRMTPAKADEFRPKFNI